MEEKPIAILTVHGAEKMSPRERKTLARWLKNEAVFIEDNHNELAKRYTARLLGKGK